MSAEPYYRLRDGEEYEIGAVHESLTVYINVRDSRDGETAHRNDYVLVFETSQDEESRDEESIAQAEKLALARTNFEKELEKQGLLLQRRSVVIQKVGIHVYSSKFSVIIICFIRY